MSIEAGGLKDSGHGLHAGVEGYRDAMSRFKPLTDAETQVAFAALRQGLSIQELEGQDIFKEPLTQERAAFACQTAPSKPPVHSLDELFKESKTIEEFITYGHFNIIYNTGVGFARTNPHLQLPLEDYFQNMLFFEMPRIIEGYKHTYVSFRNFATTRLKQRGIDMVTHQQYVLYAPVYDSEGNRIETSRVYSLDYDYEEENDNEQGKTTLSIADARATGFETQVDADIRREMLFLQANLTPEQREVIEALAEGAKAREIAREKGVPPQTIYDLARNARGKFTRNADYDRAADILNG